MNSYLNHLKHSIKYKQCFMCKHFKGVGSAYDLPEKCTLIKVDYPFNWREYYDKDKYPSKCLSVCKGIHFQPNIIGS